MIVLHDNVLVTQSEKKDTTESGIILSESIETGQKKAVVIAVGPEAIDYVEPRMNVFLDWSKAMAVTIDGLQCAVVKVTDIKLIVD